MTYQTVTPPDFLKKYVRYFWTLESDGSNPSEGASLAPLPDGCPGIIFQHSSRGSFVDTFNKPLSSIFLYGQTVRPTELSLNGQFQTLGICFYPHVLQTLYGFQASELTDTCLDLEIISAKLKDQLLNARTTSHQVELMTAHLRMQLHKRASAVDCTTENALEDIIRSKGSISLPSLQKKLQLSERGFQRKFDQYVGISPKLFARICRFQASLFQLRTNAYENLSDVAFGNGFTDQSHFIRDFKAFTGLSPSQFRQKHSPVGENFSIAG